MPQVKSDIASAGSLTFGVETNLRDRAIRRFRVRDLDEAVGGGTAVVDTKQARHKAAINAVLNEPTVFFHPQQKDLPLQEVTARKVGQNVFWVDCVYGRKRFSTPTESSLTIARFRTGFEPLACYLTPYSDPPSNTPEGTYFNPANGLPDGDFHAMSITDGTDAEGNIVQAQIKDRSRTPEPWMWRRPVVRIFIRARLSFNPLNAVAPLLNKTNRDPVTLGNDILFNPNTIRFDSVDIDWTTTRQGLQAGSPTIRIVFVVDYAFTAVQGQFQRHHARFSDTFEAWTVNDVDEYERIDFFGAFPVNI